MEYDEILEILAMIRNWGEKGYQVILTPKELEALDYAMMAVKTCQDLPELITNLLTGKEKL